MGYAWRGGLLAAILTISRAWFVAGKPEPQSRCRSWVASRNGPPLSEAFSPLPAWKAFLRTWANFMMRPTSKAQSGKDSLVAWVEIIGDTPKTCQEIAAIIRENSGFASTLPDNLQDILKNPEKSFERSLGRALARKEKRPYGENSLALQRVGTDKRAVLWRVAPL